MIIFVIRKCLIGLNKIKVNQRFDSVSLDVGILKKKKMACTKYFNESPSILVLKKYINDKICDKWAFSSFFSTKYYGKLAFW